MIAAQKDIDNYDDFMNYYDPALDKVKHIALEEIIRFLEQCLWKLKSDDTKQPKIFILHYVSKVDNDLHSVTSSSIEDVVLKAMSRDKQIAEHHRQQEAREWLLEQSRKVESPGYRKNLAYLKTLFGEYQSQKRKRYDADEHEPLDSRGCRSDDF